MFVSRSRARQCGLSYCWAVHTSVGGLSSYSTRLTMAKAGKYYGCLGHFRMTIITGSFVFLTFTKVGVMRSAGGHSSRTCWGPKASLVPPRFAA